MWFCSIKGKPKFCDKFADFSILLLHLLEHLWRAVGLDHFLNFLELCLKAELDVPEFRTHLGKNLWHQAFDGFLYLRIADFQLCRIIVPDGRQQTFKTLREGDAIVWKGIDEAVPGRSKLFVINRSLAQLLYWRSIRLWSYSFRLLLSCAKMLEGNLWKRLGSRLPRPSLNRGLLTGTLLNGFRRIDLLVASFFLFIL